MVVSLLFPWKQAKFFSLNPSAKFVINARSMRERIQQKMNIGNEMRNIGVSRADCHPVSEANY